MGSSERRSGNLGMVPNCEGSDGGFEFDIGYSHVEDVAVRQQLEFLKVTLNPGNLWGRE
jgi:hypothetical protein